MSRLICISYFCLAAFGYAAEAIPQKNPPTQQNLKFFKPFTGKVLSNKVRVRAKPDLESPIVRQMSKDELLLIVGEEGEFFAVEPPKDTKAYVFRPYVLDNVVEVNRVNVRLEPNVDAPIIAQLQAGNKVQSTVCAINHKWLEIAPPKGTRFYVSKEFISQAGGPEYLTVMEKRKTQVDQLLSAAYSHAEEECKKTYQEMSIQYTVDQFQTILRDFSDFPLAVKGAKEGLALLKETYLNKKIAFLESKAELTDTAKEELLSKYRAEARIDGIDKADPRLWDKQNRKKETLSFWDSLEESLYVSWSSFHSGKKVQDFYAEQRANGSILSGVIEKYIDDVKGKPGNYILRGQDTPLAYVYSTLVDLSLYEGQRVTLLATPRPNNHFAFPAYFVLEVD